LDKDLYPEYIKAQKIKRQKNKCSQAPVAHTCNPNYSEGRDQEDQVSKPAWANSS
jgi:hypothetical protein